MIYTHLAAAIISAALAFAGGWWVNGWRHDANDLHRQHQAAQDARKAAAQIDRAAEAYEARQAAQAARETQLDARTHAELQTPASRGACLSPGGLRILSDAATSSNAARGLAPTLPASAGAR